MANSAFALLLNFAAVVKLFLRTPDKAKDLVKQLLNLATETSDNPDLRDRYVFSSHRSRASQGFSS